MAIDKFTTLESNGENIMTYLENLLDSTKDKKTILHSISYYFGGSTSYVEDWRIKERKRRIRAIYNEKYFNTNRSQAEIYRNILIDLEKEQAKGTFFAIPLSERIIRHAIESA